MNRNGTIQGALPIVARAVGRKLNVSVGIGGRNAFTDGTHIQLPALPLEAPDDELATVAFGFLEHEAAHVRYTDMESFAPESDVHKMFTNIFEDVRIEKALGEEYPGFAEDLRGLTEILVRDGEMGGAPDPDAPLATKMGEYALLRSRYEVLGPEALKEPAELAEKAFREAVPPGLATRVGAALGQVRDLASTQAASDLAKAIIRFVEQEQQEQSEAAGDGGANGGGGGETSDDASQEAAAQGSQNDGSEAAAMAEALKEMLESDGEDGPKGLGEAAAEALSEHAAQQPHDGAGSGATVGRASKPFVVTSDGAEEIDTVSGATLALRTRLRGLLASAKQNRRRTARRGKRLDRNRLVKAMAGNPKIFVHRTQGVAVNTAVQILLDRSGSMAGREVKLARESALACGLALAEIQGVNLSNGSVPWAPPRRDPDYAIRRVGTPHGRALRLR